MQGRIRRPVHTIPTMIRTVLLAPLVFGLTLSLMSLAAFTDIDGRPHVISGDSFSMNGEMAKATRRGMWRGSFMAPADWRASNRLTNKTLPKR